MGFGVSHKINRQAIKLLKGLTDDKNIKITLKNHIKVEGVYGGQRRGFHLANTPSTLDYQKKIRSDIKRFIQSLNITTTVQYPYF